MADHSERGGAAQRSGIACARYIEVRRRRRARRCWKLCTQPNEHEKCQQWQSSCVVFDFATLAGSPRRSIRCVQRCRCRRHRRARVRRACVHAMRATYARLCARTRARSRHARHSIAGGADGADGASVLRQRCTGQPSVPRGRVAASPRSHLISNILRIESR